MQFEYLIKYFDQHSWDGTQKRLNELGAQGWEMCGTIDDAMIFKRALPKTIPAMWSETQVPAP